MRTKDVFTIPVDADRAGVGQVVGTYNKAFYFAIFDLTVEQGAAVDLGALSSAPLAFLALSFDAKVHCGDWTVIGSVTVSDNIPLPAYKEAVGDPGRIDVVDHSGKRRRTATQLEAELLPNRTIVAPIRIERALRARLGLEPWLEAYSHLEPSPLTTTDRMFASAP